MSQQMSTMTMFGLYIYIFVLSYCRHQSVAGWRICACSLYHENYVNKVEDDGLICVTSLYATTSDFNILRDDNDDQDDGSPKISHRLSTSNPNHYLIIINNNHTKHNVQQTIKTN